MEKIIFRARFLNAISGKDITDNTTTLQCDDITNITDMIISSDTFKELNLQDLKLVYNLIHLSKDPYTLATIAGISDSNLNINIVIDIDPIVRNYYQFLIIDKNGYYMIKCTPPEEPSGQDLFNTYMTHLLNDETLEV